MYIPNYDDMMPLIQYRNSYDASPVDPPNPANPGDQAIGNLLQPHMKNTNILASPGDSASERDRDVVGTPVPSSTKPAGPRRQAQLDFNLALKSDYGYNTQYLCAMGANCTPAALDNFNPIPTNEASIGNVAQTIFTVNSIWDRTASGAPTGGGNWGLDAPCRYRADSTDTFPPVSSKGCTARWWWGGWQPGSPLAWNVFGGAWPWHGDQAVVGWADGHAKSMRIAATTVGCDVRNSMTGRIFDLSKYLWDLE